MAVVHTTILELLGKQVSFTRSFEIDTFAYSIDYSGTVTAVVISLSGEPEFFVDDQGSFCFSQILDFKIIWSWYIYEISGNPWSVSVSGIFYLLNITVIIFSFCSIYDNDDGGGTFDWGGGGSWARIHKRHFMTL